MNRREMECKYCDNKISYIPSANFIIFCPQCKRKILLECEYGFGPVTPCQILLGEKKFATVKENNRKYILEIESDGKKMELKESYLNALNEAGRIVKGFLTPNAKQLVQPIEIKKAGGSLCFYGDWFGRPYDNYHRVKEYSYTDDVLEIVFEEWERLIVIEPSGITNTENEFSIRCAKLVKWNWYPYGSTQGEINKISYSAIDNQVCKVGKYSRQMLQIEKTHFAVLLV